MVGAVAEFWVNRSCMQLLISSKSSQGEVCQVADFATTLASETLSKESCLEHRAVYQIMGCPNEKLMIVWVSCIRIYGVNISARMWVLLQEHNEDKTGWIAHVDSVFFVSRPGNSRPDDRVFFLAARCIPLKHAANTISDVSGIWHIKSEELMANKEMRVFPCNHVDICELVTAVYDGIHRFIQSP